MTIKTSQVCSRCQTTTATHNGLCTWCQVAMVEDLDNKWGKFVGGFIETVKDYITPRRNSHRGYFLHSHLQASGYRQK